MNQTILPAKFEPSPDALAEHVNFLERKHGYFTLQLTFSHAVVVIAQCQLALRHPANTGPSADNLREILEAWINALEAASPGIGNQLRAGFNPNYDVAT